MPTQTNVNPQPAYTMEDIIKKHREMVRTHGSPGEAFNATEYARAGSKGYEDFPVQGSDLVRLNRYAQSYDVPFTSLLALPYENMKAMEQAGVPVLTGAAKVMNAFGAPVSPPGENTSSASMQNVIASLRGATDRLFRR